MLETQANLPNPVDFYTDRCSRVLEVYEKWRMPLQEGVIQLITTLSAKYLSATTAMKTGNASDFNPDAHKKDLEAIQATFYTANALYARIEAEREWQSAVTSLHPPGISSETYTKALNGNVAQLEKARDDVHEAIDSIQHAITSLQSKRNSYDRASSTGFFSPITNKASSFVEKATKAVSSLALADVVPDASWFENETLLTYLTKKQSDDDDDKEESMGNGNLSSTSMPLSGPSSSSSASSTSSTAGGTATSPQGKPKTPPLTGQQYKPKKKEQQKQS